MVISREVAKKIEYHFYHYIEESEMYEELVDAVATGKPYSVDITGIHSGMTSDGIGLKAVALDTAGGELKKWLRVVEKTKSRFIYSDSYSKLIEYLYTRKYSPVKIQQMLYISEATFFNWKQDIITYATVKAVEYGLIKI